MLTLLAQRDFPVDELREAAELGMGAIYCSEDVGGSGLRRLDGVRIFEQLAYADPAVAAFLSAAADDGRPDVASTSFTAYGAWVKSESDAGRTAPSGAAVRQHFGSWAAAKGAVARG